MMPSEKKQLPLGLLLLVTAIAALTVLRIIPEGPGVPNQLTPPQLLLSITKIAYYALTALLMSGCIVMMIKTRNSIRTSFDKSAIPYLILLLACCISLIINHVPEVFKPWQRFLTFTMISVLYGPVVFSQTLDELRKTLLRYLCMGCIAISVVYALALIFYLSHYTSYLSRYQYVWDWLNVASVPCGAAASIGALFAWTRLCKASKKRIKRLWWCVLALCWWTSVMASSRAAMAGLTVALTALVFMPRKKAGRITTPLRWVSFAMIAFMAVAVFRPLTEIMETKHWKIADTPTGNYFSSRQEIWEARSEEADNHWLFGIGFASVESNPGTLNPDGTIPSDGRIEPGSGWLYLLSSCGIFALAAFAVIYGWSVAGATRKVINGDTLSPPDSMLILGLTLLFGVHLITEGYVTAAGSPFYVMLWLTLGLACVPLYRNTLP